MNQSENLNAELLAADSRGRRHVPLAVFAVIMIHIVLFVVLLVAAGCRAKTRAKLANTADEPMTKKIVESEPVGAAPVDQPSFHETEPVIVTEPAVEGLRAEPAQSPRTPPRAQPARPKTDAPSPSFNGIYVVQPGDTVGKIAKEYGISVRDLRSENRLKNDLIRPGQKLRVIRSAQLVTI